jgi:asparagine synthase (glutamine-hydrolysing)
MHIYVVSAALPALSPAELTGAVEAAGANFALDPTTVWDSASSDLEVRAAGIHHSLLRCGPRRYVHRTDGASTWFDGLPVEPGGRFAGHDAGQLAAHWADSGRLEGVFSAVHLDHRAGRVEVVLDAMGLDPVYIARRGSGLLLSNSVEVLARLLGLASPDPLGVSSFLGLGWAAADRVLLADVRALEGGARHMIRRGQMVSDRAFGPASIPRAKRSAISVSELGRHLTSLTRNAVHDIDRVGCALTAGRDSRVVAALLAAAGEEALFFTGGLPGDTDVVIARELAERMGVRHEVVCHDPASSELDWTDAAGRFLAQNDGLSSLLQLPDYIDLTVPRPPLGVKLGGAGGEIGRAGTGYITAIATNAPLLRRSEAVQRRLLAMKARNDGDVMTRDAIEELSRYLGRFVDERIDEGWNTPELSEAFYAFERVGRWAATGTRRVAGTDDGFSPLSTRAFVEYCFSLSSSERYIEAAHHRLLAELAPDLLRHRFELPFHPQHRWVAPILASRDLVTVAGVYARSAVRARRRQRPVTGAVQAQSQYPFQHAWLESRIELIGELFSDPHSALWDFISRPRMLALLAGGEDDRARHLEALLRAATIAWYFHGPQRTIGDTAPRRMSSASAERTVA